MSIAQVAMLIDVRAEMRYIHAMKHSRMQDATLTLGFIDFYLILRLSQDLVDLKGL